MNRIFAIAALAIGLIPAAALAGPLPGNGITRDEMAQILTAHGYPAKLESDRGQPIISSNVHGVTFGVYFCNCDATARCGDIQFAAGWGEAQRIAPDRVNAWNTEKRFIRAYWKRGGALWGEQDAPVRKGTTENVGELVDLWAEGIAEFKQFMFK